MRDLLNRAGCQESLWCGLFRNELRVIHCLAGEKPSAKYVVLLRLDLEIGAFPSPVLEVSLVLCLQEPGSVIDLHLGLILDSTVPQRVLHVVDLSQVAGYVVA